jgi:uncharacterized protein YjiK
MKNNSFTLLIGCIFAAFLSSCSEEKPDYTFPYNTNKVSDMRFLPEELQEISGLSLLTGTTHDLACVQDEVGIIYIFDLLRNKLKKRINLQKSDDFEAIEIVDSNAYLLTSSGSLYLVEEMKSKPILQKIKIDNEQDLEGMGYDAKNNRLLIVPKTESDKTKVKIYAYDIATKKLQTQPIIHVSNEGVRRYCQRNRVNLEIPKKKMPFKPSGIAMHPYTGNIYLLASVGKVLCVLSPTGAIMHIEQLDENIYPQPEGIAFLPSGDLVIASEGDRGRLVILKKN